MHIIPAIVPSKAFEKCVKGAFILDIRPEAMAMYKSFDVEHVIWCDRRRIQEFLIDIPGDICLIVSDSTGIYSREICELLVDEGFQNVYQMAGGFIEWERDGLPVKVNSRARLSGSCVCQLKYRNLKG